MALYLRRLPIGLCQYQRIILASRTYAGSSVDPPNAKVPSDTYKRIDETGGALGDKDKVHTSKKFEDDIKSQNQNLRSGGGQNVHSTGGQNVHSTTGGTPTGGDSGLRNKLIMAASLLLFSYLVYRFWGQSQTPTKAVREAEFGVRKEKVDPVHNKIRHEPMDRNDPRDQGKVSVTNYGIHPTTKSDKADEVAANLLHGNPPGSTKQ